MRSPVTTTGSRSADHSHSKGSLDLVVKDTENSFVWAGTLKVSIKGKQKAFASEPRPKEPDRRRANRLQPDETEFLLRQIRTLTTKLTYIGEKMRKDQLIELVPSNWGGKPKESNKATLTAEPTDTPDKP